MKAKRFDSARMKQFFAAHAEKLGFVAFAIIFVWFCYSAYQTRGYDKSPTDLANLATSARNMVANQQWNPAEWQIKIPNPPYVKQVELAMRPVGEKPFGLATLFDNPIRENKVRRDEPKYLAVRELRASFGFGAVKPKKDQPLGKQWAVITGLIPVGEQATEYQKLFDNAWFVDANLDTPQWVDFQVERATVKSAAGGHEQWEPVDVHQAINKEFEQFAQERPEVIQKKFQERSMADPVPPLIGREPDENMAHPPEIPFEIQAKDKEQPKPVENVTDPTVNPLLASNEPLRPIIVVKPNEQGQPTTVEQIPYRLFRFFDYTVENDRMYRYRVKLVLKNPNRGVARRFLKKPELAEGDRRETGWSDPSTVASVPPDSRELAGDVKPPTGLNESKANVLVIKWEPPKAVEVPHEFTLLRGALINFPDTEATIPTPGQPDHTSQGKISFETNTLLVDMIGGDPIQVGKSRIKTPSVMLFMDPHGQMALHSHVADFAKFTALRPAVQAKSKKAAEEEPPTPPEFGIEPPVKGKKPSGRSIFDIQNPK